MDVELIIDGEPVVAPEGSSLLTAARAAGREVPGLCHHDAVPANASCRLCLVEIRRPGRDWTQLTTSCDYPVSAGLTVVTDSPRIRELTCHEPATPAAARPRGPGAVDDRGAAGRDRAAGSLPSQTRRSPTASCASCACACARLRATTRWR